MKKSTVIIIVVLVVLAAAIALLAVLNRPDAPEARGTLRVVCGESNATVTAEELFDMPFVEVEKTISSGSTKAESGSFRGVALREIFARCGMDISSAEQIAVQAEDGYVAAFDATEVRDSDNVFLAYSKDGEPFAGMEDGGPGPFRIIVSEDEFGTRCTKNIVEILAK